MMLLLLLFLDMISYLRNILLWIKLSILSVITIRYDPLKLSRRGIKINGKYSGNLYITSAENEFQFRLMAFFWKNPCEKSIQYLIYLINYYNQDEYGIKLSGFINNLTESDDECQQYILFNLQLNTVNKTFKINHFSPILWKQVAATHEYKLCCHDTKRVKMDSADIEDIFSSLIGRRQCNNIKIFFGKYD